MSGRGRACCASSFEKASLRKTGKDGRFCFLIGINSLIKKGEFHFRQVQCCENQEGRNFSNVAALS